LELTPIKKKNFPDECRSLKLTNSQRRELEFREGFLTDDPGAIIFNAMLHEFRFPDILRSCYPVEKGDISTATIGNTLFGMVYFGINKFSDFIEYAR
jgi:hypothetical protein